MFTYSRKITILMVGLSIASGLFTYAISGDRQISSVVMVMSFVVQVWLAFALGKVNTNSNSVVGVAISQAAQKELDYLHEATGFTAHKVDTDFRFNGHMKTKDNPEAANIENILVKYASCGYVFTKDNMLLGKISTITSKEERVQMRRSRFEVIDGFKD